MSTFTLHFAMPPAPLSLDLALTDISGCVWDLYPSTHPVSYCDGDSFSSWGDMPNTGDPIHGQVVFQSEEDDAYGIAVRMWCALVMDDLANPFASCDVSNAYHHCPFAVTSSHIWSALLLPRGRVNPTDWADHDRYSRQDVAADDETLLRQALDAIRGTDTDALSHVENALARRFGETR